MGAAIAVSVLSAYGLQDLLRIRRRKGSQWAIGLAVLAITVFDLGRYDRSFYPVLPATAIQQTMTCAPLVRNFQKDPALFSREARVFMATPFGPWKHFVDYHDFRQGDSTFLRDWADTMTPNLPMLFGIDQAGGYEPEARADSVRQQDNLIALVMSGRVMPSSASVARVVTFKPSNRVCVANAARVLPRARIYLSDHRLRSATIVTDAPDEVVVSVPAMPIAGFLVLADTMHPGWHAFVNDHELPIVRPADGPFRGMMLSASDTGFAVKFIYRPEAFALGLYVSLVAIMLMVAELIAHCAVKKPVPRIDKEPA
jgi:hypothetical protein